MENLTKILSPSGLAKGVGGLKAVLNQTTPGVISKTKELLLQHRPTVRLPLKIVTVKGVKSVR